MTSNVTISEPNRYRMHDVPEDYLLKWQETIDVLAGVFEVPAGLIMRVLPEEIEVLVRSQNEDNPYKPGEKADLETGLYCETVMHTREALHVPNALEDPDWQNNPDIKLNMTSYVGMPLIWPDNSVFGTVCLLDKKKVDNNENYLQLMEQFKKTIELDFHMLVRNNELKEASRELEEARQIAEKANNAKSVFLANMSHELRTPMNAILGYSEMLMEDAESTGQHDFVSDLGKINQAGTHLLSLINNVLDLTKIESGKMESYAEQVDVGALTDQVTGTVRPLVAKQNNELRIERNGRPENVYQDVTKLRQALLNLLSNAAKFTHDGTIILRTDCESLSDGEWLTFSVKDTGVGMQADKLDFIFEAFSQADSSTTRDYGGTGLGLAISRHFCQMMGGDLTVVSEYGAGSTFTIRVPAVLPGADVSQDKS